MKYINIKHTDLNVSNISLGCMRIAGKSIDDIEALVLKAVELGINFFDHADIYGGGKSEEYFGEVLKRNPSLREKIIIQTKCGIRQGFYDSSKEHILHQVNRSLELLKTDYIDVLLIHRPDALVEPNEVKEAFNELYQQKKVRYFGVSNMNPRQIELLKKYLEVPLVFNQVQFNIVNSSMIDSGIHVNMNDHEAINRDDSLLDYCRLNDITIQPWSILQASWEKGSYIGHSDYKALNDQLIELANKYQVTPACIAVAWILRHPANMQPIAGTTSIQHLEELVKANDIILTKEEWYRLYLSTGKILP